MLEVIHSILNKSGRQIRLSKMVQGKTYDAILPTSSIGASPNGIFPYLKKLLLRESD